MNVKLITHTPEPENLVLIVARVSSKREDKLAEGPKLIRHLIKNKHWSPFQHAYFTFEIQTSRGLAPQFLRHVSFDWQELSQRYANVSDNDMFEEVELREAATTNRQSSLEIIDPELFADDGDGYLDPPSYGTVASKVIADHFKFSQELYDELIKNGVATECARFVLPLATKTTLYMTGNIRSWIHFLDARLDDHAQKEIRLIAIEMWKTLKGLIPTISAALILDEKSVFYKYKDL